MHKYVGLNYLSHEFDLVSCSFSHQARKLYLFP
jgi:hypothetical protein